MNDRHCCQVSGRRLRLKEVPKIITLNSRPPALAKVKGKIMLRVTLKKMERNKKCMKYRRVPDHAEAPEIINMRNIIEKCREFSVHLYTCYVDYSKAVLTVYNINSCDLL